MAKISIEEFKRELDFELLEASGREDIELYTTEVTRPGLQLAGFFDYFPHNRVQVFGNVERAYLEQMDPRDQKVAFDRLFTYDIPCAVASCKFNPSDIMLQSAREHGRVVLKSNSLVTSKVEHNLINYLSDFLAPQISMHGVLMDVYGVGVLIMGQSGIGKSETALELIKRGHRLVADDAVMVKRVNDKRLVGEPPAMLRHLMEIRGVGIINVEHMYGVGAVIAKKSVDMVVQLDRWDEGKRYDRLGDESDVANILDVEVPKLLIPVMPGRNIAIIIEVAARNQRLKSMGISALDELKKRVDIM
ncbi:MAG: HPr(Ser) kinase/phosphatase [Clostridia bacterium]|nr:HPr(Ser) kinase/phosphatase [Clostridia bacterium]